MGKFLDKLARLILHQERASRDAQAAIFLSQLAQGFAPWSSSAMRPSAVLLVANHVLLRRSESVVELGSGVSTLFIGAMLDRFGGKLLSVEHDVEWVRTMETMLADWKLESVELAHVPLDTVTSWYAQDALQRRVGFGVDLAIVDGPIQAPSGGNARYPAGAFLGSRLSAGGSLLLDDATRSAERAIRKRWLREHPQWVETVLPVEDIAVFREKERGTSGQSSWQVGV